MRRCAKSGRCQDLTPWSYLCYIISRIVTICMCACLPLSLVFHLSIPGPDTKSLLNQNGRLTKFLSCCCNILYHTLVPTKNNPVCFMYRDTPAGSEGNADFMSASISSLPLVTAHEIGTMTIHLQGDNWGLWDVQFVSWLVCLLQDPGFQEMKN